MKEEKDWQEIILKNFRNKVVIAISSFLFLLTLLIIEEAIRYSWRPFYGFGKIAFNQVDQLRYLIYAISVAIVILMRLLQSLLVKLPSSFNFDQGLVRLSRATIIPLALAEVPAILGFIFFLLTGLPRDFYVLGIVSVILLFMYFPRKALWQEKLSPFFAQKRS